MSSTSYIQLAPSNHPSNSTISYRDGNPVINFILGEQDRFLIGSSVRLVGNISVYKTSDGAGFGNIPLATDDLNISPKLGVYGILDQITLSSQKTKNVIESVRHYGRFLASYLPNVSSKQEALGHMSATSGMVPNVNLQQKTFPANVNGSASADRNFRGNSFCINLPTGFLMSRENISLSGRGGGIGGLEVACHLAPDSQFLNGSWTNAFYQLTDVNLVCEVVNPSPDELSRMMSQTSATMEYNAISSYYQTIASSNAIINFRLGLSRVLGLFMSFIPSVALNNLAYDGYQTTPLINNLATQEIAPIKQVIFTRGGERLPLMYNLDTNVRDDADSTISDPQVLRNLVNSFQNFMKTIKSQQSPITNDRVDGGGTALTEYADAGKMFGVGVAFDNISGEGLDFRTENFGVQMETGLTADVPHSAFLFVRSKQTLVMNANGLQVIQ
tara:strand:+ start:1195 stop:2526 length:1332 start_codon:yes stop_codon:yes gene_type:complete